jgi:protein ImuB
MFALIVCVLLPRFELSTALRGRGGLLGVPVALAPEPGGPQLVGEVSPAAEAFGIHAGMRLGEALARCPRLVLAPPDPAGVADAWEQKLVALEGIGAAVESERAGLAYFDARGLLGLHGSRSQVGLHGADPLRRLLEATARALGAPARIGVGPVRFVSLAAATRARPRRPLVVAGGRERAAAFLAAFAVSLLRARPALADLPESLQRLGIGTLGELAALPRAALADRFGARGILAHRLACGEDDRLVPRVAEERLSESLQLPEAGSGEQLARALGMLVDRLLARREREGRSLRAVVLEAVLVERGGTWRERVVFREAHADPERMRLALAPRLALLPAPAQRLALSVERFGPACGEERTLLEDPLGARRARLGEAVRQARVAAGPDAALRVLELDPGSRLPERRAVLAPFVGP